MATRSIQVLGGWHVRSHQLHLFDRHSAIVIVIAAIIILLLLSISTTPRIQYVLL
ncbi:MAG: hypothetical protein WC763_05535 [Candidatus Paceibacterota bacterium]